MSYQLFPPEHQPTTKDGQEDCKNLALLLVHLEEIEEQIETLEYSRIIVLKKIAAMQQWIFLKDSQLERTCPDQYREPHFGISLAG